MDNTPPPNVPPLFETVAENLDLQAFLSRYRDRVTLRTQRIVSDGDLETSAVDYSLVTHLLQTAANGAYDLPEQQVEVEYLRQDQRLVIPSGLGMPNTTGANATALFPLSPAIETRYRRLMAVPYARMRDWVNTRTPSAQIADHVNATAPLIIPLEAHVWDTESAEEDDQIMVSLVYGVVSQAMQLNFDIRDLGALLRANMRLADNAWQDLQDVPRERLHNRLHAWTLTSIAALNMPACRSVAAGAWVRAYGVGCGFLPDAASMGRHEYTFTNRMCLPENRRIVAMYETAYRDPLHQLAINVLSLFGLFHLSKDHTFRTNDANMERIGSAYINALRTNVRAEMIEGLQTDKEVIVRTAPHPFGLGQTYFVARAAAHFGVLAEPLRIRSNVTPPPVQRLMVVQAAHSEWSSLPAGVQINDVYGRMIEVIEQEVMMILRNPPAYSALHRLYGIDVRSNVSRLATDAANALMPVVYGFAEAVHIDEANRRDGIALALSLTNVARDHKALATVWSGMWKSYLESMDKNGIIEFARTARRTFEETAGPVE